MQSTRMLGSNMLRASRPVLTKRAMAPFLRPQQSIVRTLRMQATPVLRSPVPKEDQAGMSFKREEPFDCNAQKLKKVPVELWPLFIVLAVALFAAVYSMIRKLYTDRTLRLYRSGKKH